MRHSRQACDHHAQGHPARSQDQRRACLSVGCRFVGSYYVNVGVCCSLNRRSWILDNGLLRRPLVLVRL